MAYKRVSGLGSALALGVFFALGGASAWADDVDIEASFDCVGSGGCEQQSIHIDADPYKGWANFTLHNIGTWGWLDFHVIIFEIDGYGSVENIDWIVSAPYEPTSSQSGLSWEVDNDAVGATIDLAFTDPVLPDEDATFSLYTDNTTDMRPRFGVIFYPTIVPEPSTGFLLALGLVGLAVHRRRRRA